MKRWPVIAGMVFAMLAAGAVVIWPEIRQGVEKRQMEREMKNLETEVVRIELAGHRFNIPMRYLYGEAIEKYHQWPTAKKERVKVDALSLSVLLPDLRPYYPEDDARWKVLGHGDRVEVTIMKPAGEGDWYNFVRQRINNEIKQGVTTKKPDAHGLVHFLTPLGPRYFPTDESNELTISCVGSHRPEPGMSYSCKTKSNYHTGIVLEYYYGIDHLSQWREIEKGLKTIFDRFAEAAQSESTNKGE